MQRRRAAAVAGAVAVTVLATVLGLGATFGLFGLTQSDTHIAHLDRSHIATLTAGTDTATTGPMPDD